MTESDFARIDIAFIVRKGGDYMTVEEFLRSIERGAYTFHYVDSPTNMSLCFEAKLKDNGSDRPNS